MSDDNGRVTVSKDFLRAELNGMELRLVDKLATKHDVVELEARVVKLEQRDQARDAVEQTWQSAFTKREKMAGLILAAIAIAVQVLLVTGAVHHP